MSSAYADEGSIAHALAAMALTEGRPASAYINRAITCDDYEHAQLSPSGAHRWMVCPGSHALETRIEFKPRRFQMTVTHEMAEGVQIYLDNLTKYRRDDTEFLVEQRLPISHITGEEGASGSGDAVILDFAYAEIQVHDLKFGKGVEVGAEENEQLALYLLAALELFADFAPDGGWKRFRGVIHQPRIRAEPSEHIWTRKELEAFAENARVLAKRAANAKLHADDLEIGEDLVPGEKQCRFCEARPKCPAAEKAALETVVAEFVDLDAVPEEPALVAIPAENARLARLVELVPMIEGWCSHIKAHAEAELLAGRGVPGFKLVQGKRGNRKWRDENEAEATLKSMRLKHDEMYDYNVISPTTAEKRLKEHPRQWNRLQGLIAQADGKPTVVPESDKRPALAVEPVANEFPVLTEVPA